MKNIIKYLLERIRNFFADPVLSFLKKQESDTQTLMQNSLTFQYRQMLSAGMKMPKLDEVGFSVYSESDEDGILNYIFSLIGSTNKKLVDIGAAAIKGSNTANLVINHGWTGTLIDGNTDAVESAKNFYSTAPSTRNFPPTILSNWVTTDNINQILIKNESKGEIDLLCIDIDGVDYWIWKAIDCIQPRVVLLEYQCIWGPEKAVTVPYSPTFKAQYFGRYGIYSGASLPALIKLGKEKGYRLIGCQRYGYNAFFIRNDIKHNIFPEIPAYDCFKHPFTHWAQKKFLDNIKNMEWVDI